MRTFSFVALFVLPAIVSACEGDCIIGSIDKLLERLRPDFHVRIGLFDDTLRVKLNLAADTHCTQPLLDAYEKNCHDNTRLYVFNQTFHGKCLDNGVEPSGCPNPDCPMICGTPGSMAHYNKTLVRQACHAQIASIREASQPHHPAYLAVEECAKRHTASARPSRVYGSSMSSPPVPAPVSTHENGPFSPVLGSLVADASHDSSLPGVLPGILPGASLADTTSTTGPGSILGLPPIRARQMLASLFARRSSTAPPKRPFRDDNISKDLRIVVDNFIRVSAQSCDTYLDDQAWITELVQYILQYP